MKLYRHILLCAPLAVWGAPAFAQAAPDSADAGGDIVVTGSRIARPETDTPSPIVAYGEKDIQQSGYTNLTDFLKDTPSLSRSVTSNQDSFEGTGSADGINTLNLRNLGDNRTLVLVDGRRHVGARQGSSASISTPSRPT